MICEMCGKDFPYLKKVLVDGVPLMVCPDCARFGEESGAKAAKKEAPTPGVISQRLERREKRMQMRNIYTQEEEVLALDSGERILKARRSKGYSQDELARKLNEKKSVIQKLEHGDMIPTDELIKKLERELGIKLMEKSERVSVGGKTAEKNGAGLTIGDLIKIEEKK